MKKESYFIRYIQRYAPSRAKLEEVFSRKKFTGERTEFLENIGYDESRILDIWITSYIRMHVGEKSIFLRLLKKKFPKPLIQSKIEENRDSLYNWGEYLPYISRKIEELQKKGKSKAYIYLFLKEKYPYFSSEIREFLDSNLLEDESALSVAFAQIEHRYNIDDPNDSRRCINSLQRRGFTYSEIKNYIQSLY